MLVGGKPYRTIWASEDGGAVEIIDQTRLPHEFVIVRLETLADAARAIADMLVRGAPLIGATAAWGMFLSVRGDPSDRGLKQAYDTLIATRPTAVNLVWALDDFQALLAPMAEDERPEAARK
ncbi:MAG: S-methyl-5-thioribose-1-phosphate isomerase, partial [Rhodospirillales bacterium]